MPFFELSNLDEEYSNGLLTLTVYNTLNYLSNNFIIFNISK